jgi:hypothetical protein
MSTCEINYRRKLHPQRCLDERWPIESGQFSTVSIHNVILVRVGEAVKSSNQRCKPDTIIGRTFCERIVPRRLPVVATVSTRKILTGKPKYQQDRVLPRDGPSQIMRSGSIARRCVATKHDSPETIRPQLARSCRPVPLTLVTKAGHGTAARTSSFEICRPGGEFAGQNAFHARPPLRPAERSGPHQAQPLDRGGDRSTANRLDAAARGFRPAKTPTTPWATPRPGRLAIARRPNRQLLRRACSLYDRAW